MKPFLDSGFLLTLLLKTTGSPKAWAITRKLDGPISLTTLQILSIENRLMREVQAEDVSPPERAAAAAALQDFRWYLEQQVFQSIRIDYEIAIELASQWQKRQVKTLPAFLYLWPALAITSGATEFLSFDPRTRHLVRTSGLKILPEEL